MKRKELYEIMENMEEQIGTKALLDSLFSALSTDEVQENLKYIDRMNDLGNFKEDEEEEV